MRKVINNRRNSKLAVDKKATLLYSVPVKDH